MTPAGHAARRSGLSAGMTSSQAGSGYRIPGRGNAAGMLRRSVSEGILSGLRSLH